MKDWSEMYAPKQTIRVTERLGFYETAEAMKCIASAFKSDSALDVHMGQVWQPKTSTRIKFSNFRHRLNPFD